MERHHDDDDEAAQIAQRYARTGHGRAVPKAAKSADSQSIRILSHSYIHASRPIRRASGGSAFCRLFHRRPGHYALGQRLRLLASGADLKFVSEGAVMCHELRKRGTRSIEWKLVAQRPSF